MTPRTIEALRLDGGLLANLDPDALQADQVAEIVRIYSNDLSERWQRYARYTQERVPIQSRQYLIDGVEQTDKINNRIPADFIGEIVDVKIGYMVGNPIETMLDESKYSDAEYQKSVDTITDWEREYDLEDRNAETLKIAAACGYAARLLYISEDGPAVLDVLPWDVAAVGEDATWPDIAVRIIRDSAGRAKQYEAYGPRTMTRYSVDGGKAKELETLPHGFSHCPLVLCKNNNELMADADKVLEEIDAYDRLMSDYDNELEQFRLAYMIITGADVDAETIQRLKQTGAFVMPEGSAFAWAEKSINAAALDSLLDRLADSVARFAKHVNFADEKFAGNLSGVALRQKLIAFESKCGIAQRKMTSMLRSQYMLLSDYWRATGVCNFNPLDLTFKFTWAVPVNVAEEAMTLRTLGVQPSKKTALSLMSWIPDASQELDRIDKEASDDVYGIDLDRVPVEQEAPTMTEGVPIRG